VQIVQIRRLNYILKNSNHKRFSKEYNNMKLYAAVLGTPFCSVVCVFQKYKELISKIGGSNQMYVCEKIVWVG